MQFLRIEFVSFHHQTDCKEGLIQRQFAQLPRRNQGHHRSSESLQGRMCETIKQQQLTPKNQLDRSPFEIRCSAMASTVSWDLWSIWNLLLDLDFWGSGGDFELELLGAEIGVGGGESYGAGFLFGADPDGAGAADQGEGIVADDFGGAIEGELDGVVGKGVDGAEFVGDAQDDAGGVGAVGVELGVVGKNSEFLIDAATGESFGDDLLALDVAFDAQVSPVANGSSQIGHKRGVAKMGKLGSVRIDFRN